MSGEQLRSSDSASATGAAGARLVDGLRILPDLVF